MADTTTAPAAPKKERRTIVTPVFRVSFPHVFKPQEPKDATKKGKYGVMAVWTPGEFSPEEKARWAKIAVMLNETAQKKFGMVMKEFPANFKKPFHRGDEKAKYGFSAQQIYASLTSHIKPEVLASDAKTPIIDVTAFYPGCYARASVAAFTYDKDGGKGIALGLSNIMFVKDGIRLDNRVDASEEFEEFANPNAGPAIDDDDLGF